MVAHSPSPSRAEDAVRAAAAILAEAETQQLPLGTLATSAGDSGSAARRAGSGASAPSGAVAEPTGVLPSQPTPHGTGLLGASAPPAAELRPARQVRGEAAQGPLGTAAGLAERRPVVLPRPSAPAGAAAGRRVRRFTSGRGGFVLSGVPTVARSLRKTNSVINKINVFTDEDLNFSSDEKKLLVHRVAKLVAEHLPGNTFTANSSTAIEQAVTELEEFNPKLQACIDSWGACALLSRKLSSRRSSSTSTSVHPHALGSHPGLAGSTPMSTGVPPPAILSPPPRARPLLAQPPAAVPRFPSLLPQPASLVGLGEAAPPPHPFIAQAPAPPPLVPPLFPPPPSLAGLGEAAAFRPTPFEPVQPAAGGLPAPRPSATPTTTPTAPVPSQPDGATGAAPRTEDELFRSLS